MHVGLPRCMALRLLGVETHACCRDGRGNLLQLNSDMCLFKDITFNGGGGGQPTCEFNGGGECGDSPTAGVVEEFAGDNNLFVTE